MRLLSSVSVAQTIIALSSVELTSILVPSHRLRIIALLSYGCRATVDGLTNVQTSSTTTVATSLDDNNLHVACRQSSKHFISGQLKVIPLFRYSVIPYSAFYSVPLATYMYIKAIHHSVKCAEISRTEVPTPQFTLFSTPE